MDILFNKKANLENILIIVFEGEEANISYPETIDEISMKLLNKQIKASEFKGKCGSSASITSMQDTIGRIILLGAGKKTKYTNSCFIGLGGSICKLAACAKLKALSVFTADLNADLVSNIAMGVSLRNYSFNKYKTIADKITKLSLEKIEFFGMHSDKASEIFASSKPVIDSVHFARNLVSEPANILFPESYAEKCLELKKLGIEVEILDEKILAAKGFNALLGVAQGSSRPARVVVMQYKNAGDTAPIAFVGKGVTFDSGGISIKPASGMEDMKYDMGGSAAVVGAMMALAGRCAKVNAVGIIGLVENMPDGAAQRPSDVVKSLSGQTIEIINTDAEGRLVLADVLWYTKERFKPKFMVDLATLTGAIVVSLGTTYGGLFSNDDELADKLFKAGIETDEKLWRLPLHKDYNKDIDSDIADVRNTQKTSRSAGSITAAEFLKRFVGDTPWAHLDIAGMAWDDKGGNYQPKGATGYGVRLLNQLVKDYFETPV